MHRMVGVGQVRPQVPFAPRTWRVTWPGRQGLPLLPHPSGAAGLVLAMGPLVTLICSGIF